MSSENEVYLKACLQGDLHFVKENLGKLSTRTIENIRDSKNASCLHYAARNSKIDIIEYLICEKNVSPFLKSKIGATLIHDAAVNGQLRVIQWLLQNTKLTSLSQDASGATIFHIASKYNQTDVVKWIIGHDQEKNLRVKSNQGLNALHFACLNGSLECVKILLDAVPQFLNEKTKLGLTPIYLAIQENHFDVVKYLVTNHSTLLDYKLKALDGMTILHVACQSGNLKMLELILDVSAIDINVRDVQGATPLHYCAANGFPHLLEYLLNCNARILTDYFGGTALHDCAANNQLICAKILLNHNIDISIRDKDNRTAAELAEINGFNELANEINYKNRSNAEEISADPSTSTPTTTKENSLLGSIARSSKRKSFQKRQQAQYENIEPVNNFNDSKKTEFYYFNAVDIRIEDEQKPKQAPTNPVVKVFDQIKRNSLHEGADEHRARNLSVISCLNALDNCIAEYDDNNNEMGIRKVVETKLVSFNSIIEKIDYSKTENNSHATLKNDEFFFENGNLDRTHDESDVEHFSEFVNRDSSQTVWPTPPSLSLIRDSEIDVDNVNVEKKEFARNDFLKQINDQIKQIGAQGSQRNSEKLLNTSDEQQLTHLPSELVKVLKEGARDVREVPLWKKQLIERKRELKRIAILKSDEKKVAESNKPEWLKELERKRKSKKNVNGNATTLTYVSSQ